MKKIYCHNFDSHFHSKLRKRNNNKFSIYKDKRELALFRQKFNELANKINLIDMVVAETKPLSGHIGSGHGVIVEILSLVICLETPNLDCNTLVYLYGKFELNSFLEKPLELSATDLIQFTKTMFYIQTVWSDLKWGSLS